MEFRSHWGAGRKIGLAKYTSEVVRWQTRRGEERRGEERRGEETRCDGVTPNLHIIFLAPAVQSQSAKVL